jgi:uncharacterized protein YbjT (DUF2867 family)
MARYNRVKGESEAAVRASGPAIVSVFRPAMIIGSQHTPWLLEKTLPLFSFITPAKYRSIRVEQIAKGDDRDREAPPRDERDVSLPGDDGADRERAGVARRLSWRVNGGVL